MNLENYSTLNQTARHGNVSDRYGQIPTSRMLTILADHGWHPSKVQEARANKEANRGFQKHIVRLQNPTNFPTQIAGYIPEIVLVNAHMGTSMFKLLLGIFRFICENGLFVGETFESTSVRHIGFAEDKAEAAIKKIALQAPQSIQAVESFRAITLNDSERMAYAESALELVKNPEDKFQIRPDVLLRPQRNADARDQSLWGTFNVVQEHLVKGGIRRYTNTGRRARTRAITSIDKNVELNRSLWMLTEKMAELKHGLNA
jgi:hypothetical protein